MAQAHRMQGVARVAFGVLGVAGIIVGLAAHTGVVIAFGVVSIIAAAGQHWAYSRDSRP